MEVSYLCFSYIKMIKTFTIMASRLVKISCLNRGILVMCDLLILLSMKREFKKLFSMICDLKVLRDPGIN